MERYGDAYMKGLVAVGDRVRMSDGDYELERIEGEVGGPAWRGDEIIGVRGPTLTLRKHVVPVSIFVSCVLP